MSEGGSGSPPLALGLRAVAAIAAVGVTFVLWYAYAVVAVEGHDSRPILQLAWLVGVGTSVVATLLVARPPARSPRVAAAYVSAAVALLASLTMLLNQGRAWGPSEAIAAGVAMIALASFVLIAVPSAVRIWMGQDPYPSKSWREDA